MPLIAAHQLGPDEGDPQVYNLHDCCETDGILDKFLTLPLYGNIYSFVRAMQGPAMEMMLRGFLIDPDERERAIHDIETRLNGIDSALQTIAHSLWGKDLNYRSSHQIKDLFYNFLKITPIAKKEKGEVKYPMNEETLDTLHDKHKILRIPCALILACRDLSKQLEKLEMEIDQDWRIRTSINIVGTNEARWSNSKSFIGTGGNLQNVTSSVRRMFIADPGHKLYSIDKEQAEARWVGFLIGILFDDWTYLDALESGDGHTMVARMVWRDYLPWTGDIKKDRLIAETNFIDSLGEFSYRQACKVLAHGTNILGKPYTLSVHTGIPQKLIEEFQEKYFTALPGIPHYHTWLAQQIQTKGFLVNPFGMRRDFFGRRQDESTVRKAAAFMQASPNGIDIDLGILNMWNYMKERIQLLTQEHDSVCFQAREDEDELALVAEVQAHLKIEFDLGFRKFSVPTDAKSGWNKAPRWKIDTNGKYIDVNPRGLDKPGVQR